MLQGSDGAAWVCDTSGHFDWRCWEGGAVVYMLATGATHEVGAAASELLALLLDQPGVAMSEADLLAALDDQSDDLAAAPLEQEQDLAALRRLLGQMAEMGLVERQMIAQ